MATGWRHEAPLRPTSRDDTLNELDTMTQSHSPPRKLIRYDSPERPRVAHGLELSFLVKMFVRLPLDLSLEIISYLRPLDLTRLSRVNKALRGFLMQRTARCIWRAALHNVKALPPGPTDLPEPLLTLLLFSPECTLCGEYTTENIDFVLQVKLCESCCETQRVPATSTLLYIPTSEGSDRMCLRKDYEKAKSKHEALEASGATQVLERWTEEQRRAVQDRYRGAALLSKWFNTWKAGHTPGKRPSRRTEYCKHSAARAAAIEARLTVMGWDPHEIRYLYETKKWYELFCNPDPLDDQAWEHIIPYSLFVREQERKRRLRTQRLLELSAFLTHIQRRLGHIHYVPRKPNHDSVPIRPSPVVVSPRTMEGNDSILPSFPCHADIFSICAESEALAEIRSQETFELQLKTKSARIEQAILDWRNKLELKLLSLLPKDTHSAELETGDYQLMLGDGQDMKPLSSLLVPVERTKLLRADAIFGFYRLNSGFGGWDLNFYPDDFRCQLGISKEADLFYESVVAKVAKAILSTIGSPDISYLAIDAASKTFRCGRCYDKAKFTSWKGVLQHYLKELDDYHLTTRNRSFDNGHPYIFTHDTDAMFPNKPLVLVPGQVDETPIVPMDSVLDARLFTCFLCAESNIHASHFGGTGFIQHHLQNVHLVGEPTEGVHYLRARR